MIVNTDPRHSAMEARALASVAKPLDEHELAWESVHTGGGCMCWETICDDAAARIWICDEGNGLGDETSELWFVGLHPYGEWNDHWQGEAPTLEAALNLAVQAMAARAFALGFQPNAPMTFREFVASGRDVPNVGAVTGESENEGPGRVYADGACYIDGVAGDWSLTLHNWTATGSTLDGLERRLYEFAAGEGYLTPRAPAPAPVPLWQREFPDFPAVDMPAIPAGWKDQSWRNDTCPFWLVSPSLGVFVDYAEPSQRANEDCGRFAVLAMVDGMHPLDRGEPLLCGDDWQAVLDFVAAYVPPAPATPQTGEAAPITSGKLRAAAVAARDMLAAHMAETFGPDESAWRETVFWSAYSDLREALK